MPEKFNPPLPYEQAAQDLKLFATAEWIGYVQKMGRNHLAEIQACLKIVYPRVKRLAAELNDLFEGKAEIVDLMLISAMAQEPMIIFGKPGTAKSELVVKFAEGLGMRRFRETSDVSGNATPMLCFEYLLNQYTEPDELLGPVVVKDLTKAKPEFHRFRDGMMPEAYIVFLDEVFKGNSAILNALLSIINERRLYEAGTVVKANTLILFGAANHPPLSEDLAAFYERFPLRAVSELVPVDDTVMRLNLLKKGWALENRKLQAAYNPAGYQLEQVSCLTDLVLCNRAIMELWGGANYEDSNDMKQFIQTYASVVASLNRDSHRYCFIDDRKYIKLFKLLRAQALYDSVRPPKTDDLRLLKHTWNDIEAQERLAELVETIVKNRLAAQGPA